MLQLEKVHVLVVDDSKTIRCTIEKYLGNAYFVHQASNGEEALAMIKSNSSIDLVFVDLHMPVMNGMMLLQAIRSNAQKRIAALPVVIITGSKDTSTVKRVTQTMGATGFIKKPFSEAVIINAAHSHTAMIATPAIEKQKISHDALTGLFNFDGFKELSEKSLAGSCRYQYDVSMLSMQIVGLDKILAEYGKNVTIQIIRTVAKSMYKSIRQEDVLAHVDSGRFAVLLPMTKSFKASIVAERFQTTVANLAFQFGEKVIRVKLAAGLNSTDEYKEKVSFNALYESTMLALSASLLSSVLKTVFYNESLVTKQGDKQLDKPVSVNIASGANHIKGEQVASLKQEANLATKAENLEQYMPNILEGSFDQIPDESVENLIEKMELFLSFAYKQTGQNLLEQNNQSFPR